MKWRERKTHQNVNAAGSGPVQYMWFGQQIPNLPWHTEELYRNLEACHLNPISGFWKMP